MALIKRPYTLQGNVSRNRWDKKHVLWEKMQDADWENIPKLTEKLKDLTMVMSKLN